MEIPSKKRHFLRCLTGASIISNLIGFNELVYMNKVLGHDLSYVLRCVSMKKKEFLLENQSIQAEYLKNYVTPHRTVQFS